MAKKARKIHIQLPLADDYYDQVFHVAIRGFFGKRKKTASFRFFLPWILTQITGSPRQRVDIVWSKKSITHNIFRFYELIFWRRFGIRPEISSNFSKGIATYKAHSFEGACALFETWIRELGKIRIKVRVHEAAFAYPGGFRPAMRNFMFSIAVDATSSSSVGNNHQSWSHTCTGSGLILFEGTQGAVATDNETAVPTYNSVNMTAVHTPVLVVGDRYFYLYHLEGPSTGSNTVQCTFSSGYLQGFAVSYSGAAQTGQPDSNTSGTSTASTSLTLSTTVVASNCWLVGIWGTINGGQSAGTGATVRVENNANGAGIYDSNGTVGTGSQSMQVTRGANDNFAGIMCSFKPLTTVDYTLTCAQGSYSLTGQALTMTQALHMTLDQGSYILTGFAIALNHGYGILCAMGSYTLTGFDIAFHVTLSMAMEYGSYVLTGFAIVFSRGINIAMNTGYYVLTGFATLLLGWFKRIKPSRGTYTPRTKPGIGSWTKRSKPSH